MLSVRRFVPGCLLLIGLSVSALLIVNRFDEPLTLEVQELLKWEAPHLAAQELTAYKLLLGVGCADGIDPMKFGEEAYAVLRDRFGSGRTSLSAKRCPRFWAEPYADTCLSGSYCDQRSYAEVRADLRKLNERFQSMVLRLNQLQGMGWPKSPFPLTVDMSTGPDLSALLVLYRIKRYHWLELLHEGRGSDFHRDLLRHVDFVRQSLDSESLSLLFALIQSRELGDSIKFYESARAEYPKLSVLLGGHGVPHIPSVDFELLSRRIMKSEMIAISELLHSSDPSLRDMIVPTETQQSQGESQSGLRALMKNVATNFAVNFLFVRRKTMNALHKSQLSVLGESCIREPEVCPERRDGQWGSWLVNPVGQALIASITGQLPKKFELLFEQTKSFGAVQDR